MIQGKRQSRDFFMRYPGSEQYVSECAVVYINTLRTGSFKLFKRPFQGFLIILTL